MIPIKIDGVIQYLVKIRLNLAPLDDLRTLTKRSCNRNGRISVLSVIDKLHLLKLYYTRTPTLTALFKKSVCYRVEINTFYFKQTK